MAIVVPSHLITSFSGKLCKRDGHFYPSISPESELGNCCTKPLNYFLQWQIMQARWPFLSINIARV
nr:MAG TPA: hypothetical protein [Caudoviricetes sp.]